MNKTEMAQKLASKTGLTQAMAAEVIDTIFSTKPGEGIDIRFRILLHEEQIGS